MLTLFSSHFRWIKQLIHDLATLQKVMLQKCGSDFLQVLVNKLLPSLGCDAATIQAYVQHLEGAQPAQWKEAFLQFLRSLKSSKK